MAHWTLSATGDHLKRDDQDDFLLADTHWAALHRAELEQFATVLDLRRGQGFNAIMMSLLPIAHDRSGEMHHPFTAGVDGAPDCSRVDEAWLERAAKMLEMVAERGLTPILMMQWVDYVPNSWASLKAPDLVMSDDDTLAMVEAVVNRFAQFDPIWSLSGDDTFASAASIERYRLIAGRLRELDTEHLVTAHTGGWNNFPDAVNEQVDFIAYQSGGGADWTVNPQQWNRYLQTLKTRRLAINLEPPYEGHGYNSGEGRYLAREVRLASWRSVITGAGAGLAYGAHGLWSWHRAGESFSSEGWSGMPFDAMVAAQLPGAVDVGWLREVAIRHKLWRLSDRGDLIVRNRSGMTVGGTVDLDLVVVHAPHPFGFEIHIDADAYDMLTYDIVAREEVEMDRAAGSSGKFVVENPQRLSEHLYVFTRRSSRQPLVST